MQKKLRIPHPLDNPELSPYNHLKELWGGTIKERFMKRAVFYGRYSSDRQTEQSIEGQRRVCEEFAKAEQIQIVGEYIDRATSGTSTEHREQFQKMLKDSKNGGWDNELVFIAKK